MSKTYTLYDLLHAYQDGDTVKADEILASFGPIKLAAIVLTCDMLKERVLIELDGR